MTWRGQSKKSEVYLSILTLVFPCSLIGKGSIDVYSPIDHQMSCARCHRADIEKDRSVLDFDRCLDRLFEGDLIVDTYVCTCTEVRRLAYPSGFGYVTRILGMEVGG